VLTSDVADGTLRLGHRPGATVLPDSPIRYQITVSKLTGIGVSGAGRVTGRDLEVDSLEVDVNGAGLVDLSGTADRQDVRLSGTGRYQAGELRSQIATVVLSGSGQMTLAVDRQLTVQISGAGTVSYSGDPSIDKSISGAGQLIKR
jgi:Putative auto-transporter adhesin, head GIN domain